MASMARARTSGSQSLSGFSFNAAPYFLGQRLADRLEVIAGIKPLRDIADAFAEGLPVTQEGRAREDIDLRARVVDVILPRDGVAGKGQQVRQRIAKDCPSPVAHMHGAGGVRRDIFDVDLRRVGRLFPAP